MQRQAVVAISVVAMLVVGGVLATSGGAQEPGGQTIKLVAKNAKFKSIDHKPRERRGNLGTGDQYTVSQPTFRAGKRVGRLEVTCTATLGGKKPRGLCAGVYTLPGGDIYASARISSSNTNRGAVTGGTGAYVGARGTFVDRAGDGGGDASDQTITLLP